MGILTNFFLFLFISLSVNIFAQNNWWYLWNKTTPINSNIQAISDDNGSVGVYVNEVLSEDTVDAVNGSTVTIVATPKDTSWHFWCWLGTGISGADRTSDTITVNLSSDINLKARFHRVRQYYDNIRVVINQPNGDTLQGYFKKWMFIAGYDDDGSFSNWSGFVDSIQVVYYSDLRDAYKYCDSVGASIFIEGEFNSRLRGETLAQEYYPVQSFFPTGGTDSTDMDSCKQYWNSQENFPAAWVLGATAYEEAELPNMSSFDCEFTGYCPSYYYTSSPDKWWITLTGALTPQSRYSPSWSAGLLLLFIDSAPNYFNLPDGFFDLYIYRYLLHRTLESEFSIAKEWSDTSGYNTIDWGLISDFGIYNAIDALRGAYGQYYFRDTDPYFKIIENAEITTDTTWYELSNFNGGNVVTELLTADEREFEGSNVGRWFSPEENTLLPSALEAKNGSKSLVIYDDVGFLGYMNTKIEDALFQAENTTIVKFSGWFKQPNLDPPNNVTLSTSLKTGVTVDLTDTNWTYVEVIDTLDIDEPIEYLNSICYAGSGGNYMFIDGLSLTTTITTAYYKDGFAQPSAIKINEVVQTRTVGTKENTTAGNWDYDNGIIYVGTNPAGKTVKANY